MTVLFGDTTLSAYTSTPGGGGYLAPQPYPCLTSGIVTSLNAYLSAGVANSFVAALYDAAGNRLAYSPPITFSETGLLNFPIQPTPVQARLGYQIFLMAQGSGTWGFGVDQTTPAMAGMIPEASVTFPIPPLSISAQIPTFFNVPVFYADGDRDALILPASGTSGKTEMDLGEIISAAFERCKIRAAVISDYMLHQGKRELMLLLSGELANRGPQLFAVEMDILAFKSGLGGMPMPRGTVDLLNVSIRTINSVGSGALFEPVTPLRCETVGLTWTGEPTPISVYSSEDGNAWTLLKSAYPNIQGGSVVNYPTGTMVRTTFYDLDGSPPAKCWKVIPNPLPSNSPPVFGAPVLNATVKWYRTLAQVPMAPYSRDDWANLPNEQFAGRPFQFWLDRQEPWPILRLWPVPTINEQEHCLLKIWRHRQIDDLGELTDRLAVPDRWRAPIIDGLAYKLSKVVPEVSPQLLPVLKADYAESLNLVRMEERENAPMRIVPQIYRYTRT